MHNTHNPLIRVGYICSTGLFCDDFFTLQSKIRLFKDALWPIQECTLLLVFPLVFTIGQLISNVETQKM